MADVRSVGRVVALMHFGGGGEGPRATGGEPLPSLASAASRRVGPCTRSVVQRSCTGGPEAASASVTPGRRADSERSGPFPPPLVKCESLQPLTLDLRLGDHTWLEGGISRT